MKGKHPYIPAFLLSVFIISGSALQAQSPLPADSLMQLVKQAYIYGYPVEQSYRIYVSVADNIGQRQPLYNHFSYAGKLATPSADNTAKIAAYKKTRTRGGAGPNNDTPYFGSLLDLSGESIVLSIPDFGDRYFSFQFIDFYNRNVCYIGSSFGDTAAAKYLLIGLGWKGAIPSSMKPIRFTEAHLNLFGRTLVEDDSADIKNVLLLQHQASLTPLSKYPAEENKYQGLASADLPVYYDPIDSFFTNLNQALKMSPAPAQDKAILQKLSVLDIGTAKGFSWSNYDTNLQRRIHNTLVQTDSLLDAEGASGDVDAGNGWQRTNPRIGNWGTDYREEALYIKHGFYAGHTQTEAFYIIPKSREGHGFF